MLINAMLIKKTCIRLTGGWENLSLSRRRLEKNLKRGMLLQGSSRGKRDGVIGHISKRENGHLVIA